MQSILIVEDERVIRTALRRLLERNNYMVAEAGSVLSGNQHQEHEDVLAAAHYVLAGDFFEENGKYHRHFDLLENPKAFNVYRKFVIKRDSFEAQSCNVDPAVVFPEQTLDTI